MSDRPVRSRRATKTTAKKATPAKRVRRPTKTAAAAAAPAKRPRKASAKPTEVSVGTDAAFAPGSGQSRRRLKNISEVRHFFRTNDVPILFFGATPFNLLGLDRWVRNFTYITYYDAWDGAHPRVFTPIDKPYEEFDSGEEINNWLLTNPEVRAHIDSVTPRGIRPKVVMVFFNSETEDICKDLGYDLILPAASLREHLDSKIVTTQLGNEAGAPSVPNVLTRVDDWAGLQKAAEKAGLGDELVVQTPYGDSGKTTFFISSEADWKKHSAEIVGEEIKVMRRINNRPVAVEAVLTRCGTVVGPFMSELIGYKHLTPSRGGWCGNEMFPEVLTGESRRIATELVRRLGDRLAKEGYRGFFEVDVLVDTDTDEVYLGELNPRISGASSITNVTAGAYADVPLFLFHLLEFMDVDFDLDVDEINERWEELASGDVWSQMIIKETDDIVQRLTATPQHRAVLAGRQRRAGLPAGRARLAPAAERVGGVLPADLRPGDYRWKGADLGVLVTKGRLQVDSATGKSALTIRARHLIDSIRAEYAGTPLANPRSGHQRGGEVGLSLGPAREGHYSHRHDSRRRHRRVPSDVTLDNWQSAAQLHWSFQHIADFLPTAAISRGTGPGRRAAVGTRRSDGHPAVRPDQRQAHHRRRRHGRHRHRRLDRHPARPGARRGLLRRHARRHLASADVGEQVAGRMVVGALVGNGTIDPEAELTPYVPALANSGYAGATVRHLLDMRSGIEFSEDYLDPDAEVRVLEQAIGWAPRTVPDVPTTMYDYLVTLQQKAPHGGPFEYRSCETDVLGWICEAASGMRMPELMSQLLWSQIGAEYDANIGVDSVGTGMFDGGINAACATWSGSGR